MDRDEILRAVEAERLDLADLLDRLTPGDWDVGSLCPGWMIRDVVAHLTLTTRLSLSTMIVGAVRARGDINRFIRESARERAAEYTPAELVAQLRATAASPRRPLGAAPLDPLVDLLVHGQDIARPLGRERPTSAERVRPALEHVWASSFYGARKRFGGLRLAAPDVAWSAGEGPEVRGTGDDVLLVLTGRPAGLAGLTGPGAAEVAARLS